MDKKLFAIIASPIVLLPLIADADIIASLGRVQSDLYGFGIGIVAVGWIIAAGLYLTSIGDEHKMEIAKTAFVYAVVGTVVLLLSSQICPFVNAILGNPGQCGGGGGGGGGSGGGGGLNTTEISTQGGSRALPSQ